MTDITSRPTAADTEQLDQILRRNRFLTISVVASAVVAVSLGGWLLFGAVADAPTPAGVDRVLGDYYDAIESNDVDTMEAITSDDFFTNQYYFTQSGASFFEDGSKTKQRVLHYTEFDTGWVVERNGAPIVTGNSPWYVAVEETWSNESHNTRYEGTANYVIIEQGATRMIAYYNFVGTASIRE